MDWWSEFADRIECDAPIGRSTWFQLGGCARYLFRPRDVNDLASLLARAKQADVPFKVLGAGANVLVSDDGFDGVVVRLDGDAFCKVKRRASLWDVGAGVDLTSLARGCSERGFSGLECMAGIPGSVGGAVRMNAGGRSGEIGDVVREIDALRPDDGAVETLVRDEISFGYRRTGLGERIVLTARLELRENDPAQVKHRFDEQFEAKKRSQPLGGKSAGCIFKNPEGHAAGALIDQAGLKGTRCGEARVSERHANFIIAQAGATASDVLRLIELVRERVRRVFGIELEEEIDIWKPVGAGGRKG
jgi:UDP-N-acetylmuramate dehydrogenase